MRCDGERGCEAGSEVVGERSGEDGLNREEAVEETAEYVEEGVWTLVLADGSEVSGE